MNVVCLCRVGFLYLSFVQTTPTGWNLPARNCFSGGTWALVVPFSWWTLFDAVTHGVLQYCEMFLYDCMLNEAFIWSAHTLWKLYKYTVKLMVPMKFLHAARGLILLLLSWPATISRWHFSIKNKSIVVDFCWYIRLNYCHRVFAGTSDAARTNWISSTVGRTKCSSQQQSVRRQLDRWRGNFRRGGKSLHHMSWRIRQ